MNNEKMYDAMTDIDEALTERALKEKSVRTPDKRGAFTLRKVIPIAVSAALIAAIAFTGVMIAYSSRPRTDVNTALKAGFDLTKDVPAGKARIAVTTDRSKISLGEALPVSVYSICGSKDGKAPLSATAKVLMSYSRIDRDNMIETVKVIDDGTDAGYTWSGSPEQLSRDEIVVPAAVFTKADTTARGADEADGVIVWALEVSKQYPDGSETVERDSAAMYYRIEGDEVYLKPSDETAELAGAAVEKLQRGLVFLPGVSSSLTHTLYDEYEYTAKWVAPELITLETKSDTAAALTELYEDLIKEYRACDLDSYYEYLKNVYERPEISEANSRIRDLLNKRMVIEALLALDQFYGQLAENDVSRMMNDFEEFAAIDHASSSKFFDDASKETMFDMYRSGRYGGVIMIGQ